MSVIESRNVIHVTLGENRLITVDLSGDLYDDVISGTPTAAETTSLGLTCGTCVVNEAALTVENKTYAIGKAVQVRVDCRNATLPTGATEAEAKVRITYNAADRGGPHTHDVKLVVHE